jgi:predicted phosphodiesterase
MAEPVRPIQTFRDPALSLWQSALHAAITRNAGTLESTAPEASGLGVSRDVPHMQATVAVAHGFVTGQPVSAPTVGGEIEECARLYAELALAKFTGDQARITDLENETRFSVCDPLWSEAILEYEKFLHDKGTIPYVDYPPDQIATFGVLDLPGGANAKVALLADWGTGMEDAQALLQQVAAKHPDVVLHLGDIYYAGTTDEVQTNFTAIYQNVFGTSGPPLYTLSGNHDMYSGGAGYYGLLPKLGQPASYFCLRNEHWQLLAMDTGLNDRDPFTVLTNLTFLNPPEVPWHQNKIATAGGRKTVLLSHHQLFSAFGTVGQNVQGQKLACNPNLQAAFTISAGENLLEGVAYWFWGHEHNLEIYQPYVGLQRGRCIGAGAIPMLVSSDPYTPATGLTLPPGETQLPQLIPNTQLATNGTVYNHAYAILNLNGPDARVNYYQVQITLENGQLGVEESVVYQEG